MATDVHPSTPPPMFRYAGTTGDMHDLLERKRQELDREIEAFRQAKEREYEEFARSLQSALNGWANRTTSSAEDPEVVPASSASGHLSEDGVSPAVSSDEELRGFVTPAFLPLLNDKEKEKKDAQELKSSEEDKSTTSEKTNRRDMRIDMPPADEQLEYIETVTSPFSSPERPPLHHRRSSSRSDTSSKRSSLKQPRTPKSEKHVLFSIDNKVVSPGTSPLPPASPDPFEEDAPVPPLDGLSNSISKSPINTSYVASTLSNKTYPPTRSVAPSLLSSQLASTSPGKTYHDLLEPNIINPDPLSIEPEEFLEARGDSDPLFDFDFDDVLEDTTDSNDQTSSERRAIASPRKRNDDDEEPLSASPHVGSLPIEIKWPDRGRRGLS